MGFPISQFIKIYPMITILKRISFVFHKPVSLHFRTITPIASFSTSTVLLKRRKIGEEKKARRIIEYPKVKGDLIDVWRDITLSELARVFAKPLSYVQELCLHQISNPNTPISDIKNLQQIVRRSGNRMRLIANPKNASTVEAVDRDAYSQPEPRKEMLKLRPPVVTVMGHVDHGKTTLLDALRQSNVVASEFGGITQHIGAFNVQIPNSTAKITFLDTPGHAAFTAMRERGARVTDIVVLVVAADDGVMEQTLESVRMAKDASVPILVAINKIDAPKADIARTEQGLAQVGIVVENLGGDTQAIPISALKRQNLEQLVEALVLQAELLEIRADPVGLVEGYVIEAKIDPDRGKLCTMIVQRGTLKRGDVLVAGTSMARVRTMRNSDNKQIESVPPGFPAEIEGWKELPSPGELVLEVASEKRAREVIKVREENKALAKQEEDLVVIVEKEAHHKKLYKEKLEMKRKLGRYKLKAEGPRKPEIEVGDEGPRVNIVLKADVDGSLEALLDTIDTYDLHEECAVDLVHYGVGALSENDLELAKTFNAIIYLFNTNISAKLKDKSDIDEITVKQYNVIYKLIDDLKVEINQRLPSKQVEEVIGEATILQLFEINDGKKKVSVAGCRCIKGILRKSAMFKIMRGEVMAFDGQLFSMRHLKAEVDTIKTDIECGLQFSEKSVEFQAGDRIICYQIRQEAQVTNWDPGF